MLKYHFSLMYNSQNSEKPDLGEQNGTLFSRLCRRADVSRFDLIRNMRVTPGLDGWACTIPSPAGDSRLRRARPHVLEESWRSFRRRATSSTLYYTERFRGFLDRAPLDHPFERAISLWLCPFCFIIRRTRQDGRRRAARSFGGPLTLAIAADSTGRVTVRIVP